MRNLYVDLLSGAAGDMLLASLVDMGFPVTLLEAQLAKLAIEPVTLQVEKTTRSGITGTQITPHLSHSHEHRHLEDILTILRSGEIPSNVYEKCEKVLDRLAEAEATVHGISKDHVHFHEIGALDTIVDILGVCMALDYFKIDQVFFSTLTDGYGTIKVAHGVMPVPVPATAALIKGYKLKTLPVATELLTPTGAALLTTLGEQRPEGCGGIVDATGYGCGSKVFDEHPNFLRVTIFNTGSTTDGQYSDTVYVLESDMDHISGEIMGDTASCLLDAGARDVCWIPVYMKKGRPGYRLSVIADHTTHSRLIDLIIRHTRTLGVRIQRIDRITAERTPSTAVLCNEPCNEKMCVFNGYSFTKPEYESLAIISRNTGRPVIELMEEYIKQQH